MTPTRLAVILFASLATSAAIADDNLGRLFFTPEQRAALDAGKQINKPKGDKRAVKRSTPATITLNGIVVRSDGERTVWINDRAYQGRDPAGLRVRPSGKTPAVAEIQVREEHKRVELRVGQTYRASSGKITEAYESKAGRTDSAKSVGKGEKTAKRDNDTPSNAGVLPEKASDN